MDKNKYLFYDLETTGLDPQKNAIHQLAYKLRVGGETVAEDVIYMSPGKKKVEEAALKVSGVTDLIINSYPSQKEGFLRFKEALDRFVDSYAKYDKIFLVGYNNISFDDQFLRQLWKDQGDRYYASLFWVGSLDLMPLCSFVLRDERKDMVNFKLTTVAEFMGIEVDESKAHDAKYDMELVEQIFDKITEDG